MESPFPSPRTRTTGLVLFALIAQCVLSGCGDDPVPVDEIPEGTRLLALNDQEFEGVCEWARLQWRRAVRCEGQPLLDSGCQRPTNPACTVTVGEYRTCYPAFIAQLDGCRLAEQIVSGEFAQILDGTPGCEGMTACVEARTTTAP